MARRGERAMILAMRRAGALKSDPARIPPARRRNTEQYLILLLTGFTAVKERRQEMSAILTAVLASPAAQPALEERKATYG